MTYNLIAESIHKPCLARFKQYLLENPDTPLANVQVIHDDMKYTYTYSCVPVGEELPVVKDDDYKGAKNDL